MLRHCAGDGGKKARSPGRLRRKPLKPLRRECRTRFGDLWWTYSYAFFICMRGCGCGEASGIPCSLFFRGTMTGKARAKFAARRRSRGCLIFGSVRIRERSGSPRPACGERSPGEAKRSRAGEGQSFKRRPVPPSPQPSPRRRGEGAQLACGALLALNAHNRGAPGNGEKTRQPCHFGPLGLERRHVRGPRTPGGLPRT